MLKLEFIIWISLIQRLLHMKAYPHHAMKTYGEWRYIFTHS